MRKILFVVGLIFATLFSARVFALTNVTSCQSLDTEDEIYYLTQNITAGGDCFDITASNVTLDCLGHQIYGLSSVSLGVGLWNTSDTVQNCIINNYGDGILSYSHDDIIRNNTITGSTFGDASGIFEGGTCHNTIYNNNLYNNSANLRFSVSPCSVDLIYNNIINGSIYYDGVGVEYFNTTEQLGKRIFSSGMYIGGNYWTNSTGNGYSDTCTDSDHDGFCDSSYSPPVTSGSITDYLPLSDEYVFTNLTGCGILSQSGVTYYLASDIGNTSGGCIQITADDIVLDCQNNLIENVEGSGITGSSLNNITIENCRLNNISLSGADSVHFDNSVDVMLDNIYLTNDVNGQGIAFSNSNDTSVTNSYVDVNSSGAGHAVYWSQCDGMYAYNNTLSAYTGVGGYAGLRPEFSVHGFFDRNIINGRMAMWEPNVNDSVWTNNIINGTSALDGMNDILINNTFTTRSGFYITTYGNFTFVNNSITSTYDGNPPLMFYGGFSLSDFESSNISDNIGNGLPIYYFFNRSADIDGLDTHSLTCVGCHDMTIKNIYEDSKSGLNLLMSYNITVRNVSISGLSQCFGLNATVIDSKFDNGAIGFDCYWDYPQPFSYVTFIDSEMTNNTYADIALLNSNFTMINTTFDVPAYGDSNSFISRYWYLDLSVNPLSSTVTVIDSKNNTLFSGSSPVHLVGLEYVGFCESPDCDQTTETRDYYTPYTVTATSDYYSPLSESFDLTGSSVLSFDMFTSLNPTGMIISDIGSGIGNFLSAIYLPLGNLILILGIIAGVVAIFMGIAYVIRGKLK